MSTILGLDLGPNSIGWALVEKLDNSKGRIVDMGARVFPEGVESLGQGEKELSKNATRRGDRQTRRQNFRSKFRKKLLLEVMSEHGMCPLTEEQISQCEKSKQFPDTPELREWFRLNPYYLRKKAVEGPVSLMELGRIFYHLAQRRGFLSNSRSALKEEGKIFDGIPKEGKVGINETRLLLSDRPLGHSLASIYPKDNESYQAGLPRIRNRYTERQWYINEFENIWHEQAKHHRELTDGLKERIGGRKKDGFNKDGILFYQRPLRSQKHLIGYCTFEPKKPRCPISAIPFELFRAYQFVNSIECDGEKLNEEDHQKAMQVLLNFEKPKFARIRKELKNNSQDHHFNYQDDDVCPGTWTISQLSGEKYFGPKWFSLSAKEQDDIWHILYFFDDKDKLKEYAIAKWGFDEEQAEAISKFHLKNGYASLSRKAINNILPFLKMGLTYDVAVVLGGIRNAFGDNWEKLDEEKIELLINHVPGIVRSSLRGGYIDMLNDMLRREFSLSNEQLGKLYHHSASVQTGEVMAKLPTSPEADREIMAIRNPVVVQALFELRKLVNAVVDEYGPIDEIKVEIGRDLKVSKTQRNKIRQEQKRLEEYNQRVIDELRQLNQVISHENILKYKLWKECQLTCPYTGRKIEVSQLFSGEVQIEHIFPWTRSLDDSYLNKTLCFADENRKKGDRTPYEYFNEEYRPEKWEQVKARALKLFHDTKEFPNLYRKYKRFVAESFDDDFVSRQLNDTRYISRQARTYLQKICRNVLVAPGGLTANLRSKWGLNSILSIRDEKERDDHRHHAIDALVMACFTIHHLNEISKWNRYRRTYDLEDFPMPWDGFHEEAKDMVHRILVSHKKTDRILTERIHRVRKHGRIYRSKGLAARGQLHREFVYGKRIDPDGEQTYHIRKPLSEITMKTHVEKIVDEQIRKIIKKRIDEDMGGYENGKKVPKGTFFDIDDDGNRISLIKLPNQKGDPVPVYKVRIRENIRGAELLKKNQNKYVNPRNNHHVLIYQDREGNLKEEVVTFWTAVERKLQGQPVFHLPPDGKESVTALQINDMFLLELDDDDIDWENVDYNILSRYLYKTQKLAGGDYFFELCFRHHTDSRKDMEAKADYIYIKNFGDGKTGWFTYKPIKVTVSLTGKIQKSLAHD